MRMIQGVPVDPEPSEWIRFEAYRSEGGARGWLGTMEEAIRFAQGLPEDK